MLRKATSLAKENAKKLLRLGSAGELTAEEVQIARDYIADYWQKLERFHPKDEGSVIGLPKPYLVPAYEEGLEFDFNELYYWDSYFMAQGILDAKHRELAAGILEDLLFLFDRFKVIPNASRTYLTGRSQPPVLSSFIRDIYDTQHPSEAWLKKAMASAQEEYQTVWMGSAKPHARQVYMGLSRYYDINMTHDLAEAESGWDYTPRFNRHALNYLPVDLNALLYKYETDFAWYARKQNDKREAARWEQAAKARKEVMHKLMWDKVRGLYFDYNYVKEKRGGVASLAAFYPMWVGMVDDKQAAALVKSLRRFEQKGGLATTAGTPLGQLMPGAMPTQWAYPNGWAPLHFIVIQALERYGYHEDARRIAFKWLRTNLRWFALHGVFLEKYNVVNPGQPPVKGVYPSQTGFGWTNAIFERLCHDYIDTPPRT